MCIFPIQKHQSDCLTFAQLALPVTGLMLVNLLETGRGANSLIIQFWFYKKYNLQWRIYQMDMRRYNINNAWNWREIQKKAQILFIFIIIIYEKIMDGTQRLKPQEVAQFNKKSHLKPQHYQDIPTLNPLSLQVISRQATINIGTIGHVAHGKSTVVKAISGVQTVRFRQEKVRNITIRLGYANAKIYKCPKCPSPQCYKSFSSDKEDSPKCDNQGCTQVLELQRHVSFCDCPGHDSFMSTMLTGAAVMDAAMLLVAANVQCPQPQTAQHLVALEIMKLEHMIILQNKIDIIFKDKEKLKANYKQIKEFMKDSICKNAPIIPISAQMKYNIDGILEALCEIPIPKRRLDVPPRMIIIRSFDVNKPGAQIDTLKGGVVGGSILEGVLEVGMEVQIRPGYLSKDDKDNLNCTPIRTRIVSLEAEKNDLLYAVPGGLIGVGLLIDPSMTRNDRMVGNVLGAVGTLPDIYIEISVKFYLMKQLLGVKKQGQKSAQKIKKIVEQQTLKFNVASTETAGRIIKVIDDIFHVRLSLPICTKVGEKVAFSRRFEKKYRLIGYGEIKSGKTIQNSK